MNYHRIGTRTTVHGSYIDYVESRRRAIRTYTAIKNVQYVPTFCTQRTYAYIYYASFEGKRLLRASLARRQPDEYYIFFFYHSETDKHENIIPYRRIAVMRKCIHRLGFCKFVIRSRGECCATPSS